MIAVDIDGTIDPGMYMHETAHAIASVYSFDLQMITPLAVRAWVYVNCYSSDRGISRFHALWKWADLLRDNPFVLRNGVTLPAFHYLRRWAKISPVLSSEALGAFIENGVLTEVVDPDEPAEEALAELKSVARWSLRVDQLAREASQNIVPFPNAVLAVKELHQRGCDICAVSSASESHVLDKLYSYGLLDCFRAVFAQQAGRKSKSLFQIVTGVPAPEDALKSDRRGRMRYDICCMFGDAPTDYTGVKEANRILSGEDSKPIRMFFIEDGAEDGLWAHFREHVADRLLTACWPEAEEQALIEKGIRKLSRTWDANIMPIDTFPT